MIGIWFVFPVNYEQGFRICNNKVKANSAAHGEYVYVRIIQRESISSWRHILAITNPCPFYVGLKAPMFERQKSTDRILKH